jgi:hypothetical protein
MPALHGRSGKVGDARPLRAQDVANSAQDRVVAKEIMEAKEMGKAKMGRKDPKKATWGKTEWHLCLRHLSRLT